MPFYLKEAASLQEVSGSLRLMVSVYFSQIGTSLFDVFGADRLAQFNIHSGEEILVSFDIDAHEYQGRWFNSIRAWNVTKVSQQAAAQGGGFSGNAQSSAQAAQQAMASSANAAGVANPTNQQNLFPPEQQSAQQQAQQRGNSDDLPF